jgi:DNA repair protein RadC
MLKNRLRSFLSRFGNLYGVLNAPFEKLREVKRIGMVDPVAFRIIREAAGLYLQQEAGRSTSLTSLDALSAFWRVRLRNLTNE